MYEAREVEFSCHGRPRLVRVFVALYASAGFWRRSSEEGLAWQTVCPQVFGLGAARPDAVALLEWINGPANDRLYPEGAR